MIAARRAIPPAAVLLLWLCPAIAAGQDAPETSVRKTVDQFCAWDFQGARLTSKHPHWKDENALLAGSQDWPEEPIDIVAGYRIGTIHTQGDHASVEVRYRLLAELRGGLEKDALESARRRQTVSLPATRVGDRWTIDAGRFPPHVSADAMRAHIAQIRQDDEQAGDHHRQDLLASLISQLGNLGADAGASRNLQPLPHRTKED